MFRETKRYSITKYGKEGFKKRAEYSLDLTKYTEEKLNALGKNA